MEMQQTELFATRHANLAVVPYLRIVEQGETAGEVGHGVQRRDQPLFSHEAFEHVLEACASFFAGASCGVCNHHTASELTISALHATQGTELGQRVRDNFLRVVGWFHSKRAARRGGAVASPLGLFDKGPKIVRRDRGGVVHSYYLWRAVYSR